MTKHDWFNQLPTAMQGELLQLRSMFRYGNLDRSITELHKRYKVIAEVSYRQFETWITEDDDCES